MNKLPQKLKVGDEIRLIAPANAVEDALIQRTVEYFNAWGLRVSVGQNVLKQYYRFSASDEQRLSDLQEALDSKAVKAIVCLRGGYGCTRIIDKVSLIEFKKYPKWLIGFSDITALHALLLKDNLIGGVHGPMPIFFDGNEDKAALNALKSILFEHQVKLTLPPRQFQVNG